MLLFLTRFVISSVATFAIWVIASCFAYLAFEGLEPAVAAELLSVLREAVQGGRLVDELLARPPLLVSGLAVAGVIVMYQKVLLFFTLTIQERLLDDLEHSERPSTS